MGKAWILVARSRAKWSMADTPAILPARSPVRFPARPGRVAARESRCAVALVAPAVGLVIACTDWEFGAAAARFVGLGNFRALASDPVFWKALGNTLIYAAVVVPACVGGGLALALLIESGERLRAFYRTAHFL